jgi:peptidoglycan/LPS O-acetylase OafA/YrhL
VPLSSPACDDAWRRLQTKQFFGSGFAVVVAQCFSSAYRVIAGIAIAAPIAASRCGGNNAVVPAFFHTTWLIPVFWTLAVEFQYYVLLGLFFPLLFSNKPVGRSASVLCFFVGAIR